MKINKIVSREFDETNSKDVSKKIDIKKVNIDKLDINDLLPIDSDIIEINFGYNNGWDRKASAFTSNAKKRYIDADKGYYKLTASNMTIHSGHRDVKKQAQLYIQYKYHNQGNPASWPGCSFHNWGLAADMIRKNESALVSAMNKGGWTRTVGDEAWHFECTSSSDHRNAANKIKKLRKSRTGAAYKWSEQVALFYQKNNDYQKRAPVFNKRLEKHKSNGQQLQIEINSFNNDLNKLKNRINVYNSSVRTFNSELARAKRLYNEIMNLPPGPERNRKIREYNRLTDWLKNESNRINRESKIIDAENVRITRWSASLEVKIGSFKQEESWLNSEYNALTKIETQIKQHKKSASDLLNIIGSIVI